MAESLDLYLNFDRVAGFPGRTLEAALREAIRTDRLLPGSRLPGSRSLANDLGLARGTVVQAYAQLVAEGWLVSVPGSGTRVARRSALPGRPGIGAESASGSGTRVGSTYGVGTQATSPSGSPRAASPDSPSRAVAPARSGAFAGGRPGKPAVGRPGKPAAERPGKPAAERPGKPAAERPGKPAAGRPGKPAAGRRPAGSGLVVELRPGVPDLGSFPRAAWAAAVRRGLAAAPNSALDYVEPTGLLVLREAVADYVARTRGVVADAGGVVITAGFTSGLALLGRALRRRGARVIATENPGLVRHRDVLRGAGMTVTPLAVGPEGAEPDDARGQAALLTPAHQHPTGVVLAPRHRSRFIDWARANNAFLIEDDYDGEFRYDQRPVGAMQALAPERIVYAGSTSKSLAPGVRLGWLIVPAPLRRDLAAVISDSGAAVSVLDQLAMADLINHGDYDRHVRRMRLAYRRRRASLAEAIGVPLEGIAAGMHALLPLGSAAEERQLITKGRHEGLVLTGLHGNGYWHDPSDADQPAALILGYAAPPAHLWPTAMEKLAELVQQNEHRPDHFAGPDGLTFES